MTTTTMTIKAMAMTMMAMMTTTTKISKTVTGNSKQQMNKNMLLHPSIVTEVGGSISRFPESLLLAADDWGATVTPGSAAGAEEGRFVKKPSHGMRASSSGF